MHVIAILIAVSLVFALFFLVSFIWAVKSGQYEDTVTPSMRVLTEEEPGRSRTNEFNKLNINHHSS